MKTHPFLAVALALIALGSTSHAATITGSFTSTATVSGAPLDTLGDLDWSIWESAVNFTAGTVPLHNEKTPASAISNLTATFGNTATGSSFSPSHTYTYTTSLPPRPTTASNTR